MSTPEPTIDLAAPGHPPVLRTLIRREFWEHRALWMAPLAVATLLLIGAIIGKVDDSSLAALPEQRRALFGVVMAYAAIPQTITLVLITWIYAGDCLYTERKDRSILFWKSMPVSNTLTVLSKLLVVMAIVPLGVYLVSALTTLLMSGIYLVRAWQGHAGGGVFWDAGTWLRIQGVSLLAVVAGVLWFSPITALLLLLSAWARRSVWLWVFLPPVILIMLERIALGTSHLLDMLLYRLGGVFTQSGLAMHGPGDVGERGWTLNLSWFNVDPLPAFSNADLWLGVGVAALLIVATIRIRQYRDDT